MTVYMVTEYGFRKADVQFEARKKKKDVTLQPRWNKLHNYVLEDQYSLYF